MNQMSELLNFFISAAHAEAAAVPQSGAGGGLSLMMMAVIFFVFLYFGVWRPQAKRAREQNNLLSSLAKGDEIVTAGGLLGRINKITDQYVAIGIANNVEIVLQKSSVVGVLPKGTLKTLE
jgi:preprotein translocase subunit YajC